MLQTNTLDPSTLHVLKNLNKIGDLEHFALGGGTALALLLGHRISVDLDLFTLNQFDSLILADKLREVVSLNNITTDRNSLSCNILTEGNTIKVDLLRHNYKLLKPPMHIDDIRILSLEDVTAMKLNALTNRGAKKDFYDIYSLLNIFSVEEMLRLYEKKYPDINSFSVVKSLTFFEDADKQPDPISLINISWPQVKKKIKLSIKR